MIIGRRLVGPLVGSALVLCAAPAAGLAGGGIRHFTTGSFVVNCTSTGELCSPAEPLTFRLPSAGTLASITYSTAASHCSPVLLHVLRRGHQITQTHQLPAGQQSERLTTHIPLSRGRTTLAFKAQGFVSGCNSGLLGSWGGTVSVVVKLG